MRELLTFRAFLHLLLDGLLERLVVYHVVTPLRHARVRGLAKHLSELHGGTGR